VQTDEELAAAVEKIIAAAYEILPKLKIQVSDLVRLLADDEWIALREDEDRRRPGAVSDVDASKVDLHDVIARYPALVRIKRDLDYRLPGSGRPLANIALTRAQAIEVLELCIGNGGTGSGPSTASDGT
jgi:hypothetical protein